MIRRLALLVLLLAPERPAGAFYPKGHEVIEACAYRDLLAREDVAGTSGKEILAYLIRHHALAKPRCFDADRDDDQCGDGARRTRPVDFWPVLGSGTPDMLQSRQFGPRGQCYHFMADYPDWRKTARDPASGATVGMARDAYARCIRLATSLFDETLRDANFANLRGRGTYILMHAIVDAFSHAHVERVGGAGGKIRYLKVWIVRTLVSFPFDARHFDARLHHKMVDSRDGHYIDADRQVGGKRCGDYRAAYEVPLDCLSAEGRAAEEAVVDLLVTTYLVFHHTGDQKTTSIDDDFARRTLGDLLQRRLASDQSPLVVERQRGGERDWEPNLMLAARVRPNFNGPGWDAGATLAFMRVLRRAIPLVPLAALTLGYGRFDGAGRLLARSELSFLMPVWDYLGLGWSPIVAGLSCDTHVSDCRGDLLTSVARLSFFWRGGLWLDVSGPEYSWVDRAWTNRVAFTAGAAFDLVHSPELRRRLAPMEPKGPWDPPALHGVLLRGSPPALEFFVEGDILSRASDHLLAAGFGVLRERDRDDRRAGFGLGVELSYQRGRYGDRQLDAARLAPLLGYYLVPEVLALRVAPATLSAGKWGDEAYFDVGLSAQLDLSLSALEVSLCAPRISYLHTGENRGTPIALRFTWRVDD